MQRERTQNTCRACLPLPLPHCHSITHSLPHASLSSVAHPKQCVRSLKLCLAYAAHEFAACSLACAHSLSEARSHTRALPLAYAVDVCSAARLDCDVSSAAQRSRYRCRCRRRLAEFRVSFIVSVRYFCRAISSYLTFVVNATFVSLLSEAKRRSKAKRAATRTKATTITLVFTSRLYVCEKRARSQCQCMSACVSAYPVVCRA